MSPLFATLLPVLVDLAVKSAAVMLFAALAAAVLARASAAWRHLVWSLGVLGLLVLPVFSLALPAWRVSWLPQLPAAPTASVVSTKRPQVAMSAVDNQAVQPVVVVMPAPRPTAVAHDPAPSYAESHATGRSAGSEILSWLAPIWLAGVLFALMPLIAGLWQLTLLRARSSTVGEKGWLSLVSELCERLRIRRRVQLRQSKAAVVPLTWGALRPVLLVPTEADKWPAARRRLVLLHELAHVRRWDWLTQMLAHVACCVYWFNPLVWYAAQRMRIEREQACDDLVLASGAKASDYAQELLGLASSLSDPGLTALVAVPMARPGMLEDRVRGILDPRRSRTALTTAAVGLAAILVAATVAPLAMLRAAPPKPDTPAKPPDKPAAVKLPENTPAEKPVQRDPTPEELDARSSGIRISVLNAAGDKGIPEFRVIAGIDGSSVSEDYVKRTGRPVINWQPHTCRIGKEGDHVWPLDKAYAEMAIRVEADGYVPQVAWPVLKAKGPQHIVFQLTEDLGVAGRVLTPDGKPTAGATVALAIAQKDIVWEGGRIRGDGQPLSEKPGDRWRRPTLVKTDAEGRFTLPTEPEPAAILVVHEAGVRELEYGAWRDSPEIKLQNWGAVAGQVRWKDKPGSDQDVTLIVHRHEYGYPGMIASYTRTKSDQDGRFTFDQVLPGKTQISLPIKSAGGDATISEVILNGMFQHVHVAAGQTTMVLLGGQGRTVTGKLVGLDSWDGVTFHFHPAAPHIGFPSDDAAWRAFGQLKASESGPLLFRDKQPANKDGTFTIENMLPGSYQLFVSVPGQRNYAASVKVEVEPEVFDQKPAAQDLGEIKVTNPAAPAGEAAAAPAAADKPEGKTVTIRGKVVDDETGEPIDRLITQAGKFDPADPTKVTWGYSEGRSSARDGSFSTTVRWDEGWTARIIADGYVPQPVLTAAPPAGKDTMEVLIRLKRGRMVRGVVLDHTGKPLKDAAVFAIGPTGLNLADGQAWTSYDTKDDEARPAKTDEQGRFELTAGEAKALAVSHAAFDAWPAAIPASGDVTIRLPEPARVEIELDIDGAAKDSRIFYQLLTHKMPEFAGLQSTREVKIANPGKASLAALPPGRYQLCREVMSRLGEVGIGGMLDREFFEVQAGEAKKIDYVRETGARLRGKAVGPADVKLMGVLISVRSETPVKDPFDNNEWTTTYSSQAADKDHSYLTERILPGKYVVVAEGYTPLTEAQRFRTGVVGPAFRAEVKVEVPAEGEAAVPDLVLK